MSIGIGILAIFGLAEMFLYTQKESGEEQEEEFSWSPLCGEEAAYSKKDEDHYCWSCEQYLSKTESGFAASEEVRSQRDKMMEHTEELEDPKKMEDTEGIEDSEEPEEPEEK